MAEPVVRTSSRLWSQEVAIANAASELDSAGPGADGLARLLERDEPGYEFSGNRKFKSNPRPYE